MFKKILIINPFGIGDVLFTTPVIHTLKSTSRGIKIGYLCNRRAQEILEGNPYIDTIFVYERDEFVAIKKRSFFAWLRELNRFLGSIKKERFDAVLDFSLNTQYGFFSWFCNIRERIGYDFKRRGRFLTRRVNLTGYNDKHIVEYYGDLLGYLGIELRYRNLELYLKEQDIAWADEALAREGMDSSKGYVAIIPGAGKSWGADSHLKHWAPENFAELADKIIEKYKTQIIIMGDSSEKALAQKLKSQLSVKVIDFCGKTTLGQFAALLGKAKMVVANDGGPLHMAVALGKKTISFFGPVDPKVYGPYPSDNNRHIVLRRKLECSPCYRNFRLHGCLRNKVCLRDIDVQEALKGAAILLSEK